MGHRWIGKWTRVVLAGLQVALAGCGAPPQSDETARSLEALRGYVTPDRPAGIELSYLAAGDGMPVIMVHGTPGAARNWGRYLRNLPPDTMVMALDRPGFGNSGPEGPVTSLSDQAAAVTALLDRLGRPAVLVGHSLGGPIIARAALERPDKVAALVMLAASLDPRLEEIHPAQYVGDWWWVRAMLPRDIRNANSELLALKPELEELATRLGDIRAPVIIVHGKKDDLVPYANVDFMRQAMTGVCRLELVTLEGADHFLPWQNEADVRAAIARARELAC